MSARTNMLASMVLVLVLLLMGGCSPNPQPVGLTPIPTLAPAEPVTLVPVLQTAPTGGEQPGSGETAQPATPPPTAAGDAAKGEQIYTQNCAVCHGPDAAAGPVGPTLISAALAAQPDGFYQDVIINGRAGTAMPAWGDRLIPQEIAAVIAFLRSKQ